MSRILFHGQAGPFGFKAAQARPDKVRALIAVEPAAAAPMSSICPRPA
jgi:pimeloyl-ACP methyl ester carboxylesterase